MKDQTSIERQTRLLRMLTSNTRYTVGYLAEVLGVSERTVYRYVDALRQAGYNVKRTADNRLSVVDFRPPAANLSAANRRRTVADLAVAMRQGECVKFQDDPEEMRILETDALYEPYAFDPDTEKVIAYSYEYKMNEAIEIDSIGSVVFTGQPWAHEAEHREGYFDLWGGWGEVCYVLQLGLDGPAANDLVRLNPLARQSLRPGLAGHFILDSYYCDAQPLIEFCMTQVARYHLCSIIKGNYPQELFAEHVEWFKENMHVWCTHGDSFFE